MDKNSKSAEKFKMQLRSETRIQKDSEYNSLKLFLESFGYFEEGMQLEEMRNLFTAVKDSSCDVNPSTALEAVLLESSLIAMEDEKREKLRALASSTMIDDTDLILPSSSTSTSSLAAARRAAASTSTSSAAMSYHFTTTSTADETGNSSDDEGSQIIVVQAQVHHAIDWSPTNAGNERKRKIKQSDVAIDQLTASGASRRGYLGKRLRYKDDKADAINCGSIDSGVALAEAEDDSDLWDVVAHWEATKAKMGASKKDEESTNL